MTVVEHTHKVVGLSTRSEPFGPGRDNQVSSFLIGNICSTAVEQTLYNHEVVGSSIRREPSGPGRDD